MPTIAVKFENASKYYKLYKEPKDRLKEALHPFKKKYHREFFALNKINLDIKQGEILGIVGRNGAGKSTMLKLISGIIQPSSGLIKVNGSVSALLELGSGLNPDFTGMQNIYFFGTMMGFSREEMKMRVNDIIDFAEIGDFISQPLKTYSSGMKARLGFALAININPTILIVDEVLAVGDELFRRKCFTKMENLFKSGCTVIYVSHSSATINDICTRAILLDKGEIILDGTAKLVTTFYQKLLFAGPKKQQKTREEIIQLNQDEKKKKLYTSEIEDEKTNPTKKDTPTENKDKENQPTPSLSEGVRQKSYFIPGLKPKSTVEYKNYDVDITDIHIKTPNGSKVNALVLNEQYIYTYNVKFNIDAKNVIFGTSIKTTNGVLLWGMNSQSQEKVIHQVRKGDTYLVEYDFACHLLPGIYYANAGVTSMNNSKRIYLNRIMDALVFKVQTDPGIGAKGLVQLFRQVNIIKK